MPSHKVYNEYDRDQAAKWLLNIKPPFTVNVVMGKPRSLDQNRLQRKWLGEAAEQLDGHTAEELRGLCKLMFGVPILKAESEAFAAAYDARFENLPYEDKLAYMMEPFDFKITRLMTTKQKAQYLDAMQKFFTEQGVRLTIPNEPPQAGPIDGGNEE